MHAPAGNHPHLVRPITIEGRTTPYGLETVREDFEFIIGPHLVEARRHGIPDLFRLNRMIFADHDLLAPVQHDTGEEIRLSFLEMNDVLAVSYVNRERRWADVTAMEPSIERRKAGPPARPLAGMRIIRKTEQSIGLGPGRARTFTPREVNDIHEITTRLLSDGYSLRRYVQYEQPMTSAHVMLTMPQRG